MSPPVIDESGRVVAGMQRVCGQQDQGKVEQRGLADLALAEAPERPEEHDVDDHGANDEVER